MYAISTEHDWDVVVSAWATWFSTIYKILHRLLRAVQLWSRHSTVDRNSHQLFLFYIFLPQSIYYYSFQPWIYISWFDNVTVKKDCLSQPQSKPFVRKLYFFVPLTLSYTIYYLSQSSVLQMVSGLGQIRALQTIWREMDSWTICVNGEIGKGVTVALERGQTMPVCRKRKSLFHLRQTQFHINE